MEFHRTRAQGPGCGRRRKAGRTGPSDYRAARGLDRALFQALDRRPLDRRGSEPGRRRASRCRQILAGLRARTKGLPRQSLGALPAHPSNVQRSCVRSWRRAIPALGGVKLLILDDWGLEPLGPDQRHDMLEIVEDRYGRGAILITSQIPVDRGHDLNGQPTLADAILHRWLRGRAAGQTHSACERSALCGSVSSSPRRAPMSVRPSWCIWSVVGWISTIKLPQW
jgi:hypothetical protein